jgi:acyl dehydratase
LTGDKNLIHIDPNIAKKAGLEKPILHGLCTYGISARAVFEILVEQSLIPHNVNAIERIGSRFTSPVYPGETLDVKIWNIN